MQADMFDKPIAEIRAVQLVDQKTGRSVSWNLEFRFVGEDKWNPVKIDVFAVDVPVWDTPEEPAINE